MTWHDMTFMARILMRSVSWEICVDLLRAYEKVFVWYVEVKYSHIFNRATKSWRFDADWTPFSSSKTELHTKRKYRLKHITQKDNHIFRKATTHFEERTLTIPSTKATSALKTGHLTEALFTTQSTDLKTRPHVSTPSLAMHVRNPTANETFKSCR